MNPSYTQLIHQTANQLKIDEALLADWLDQYIHVPRKTIIHLCHLAQKYQLDPLSDEVSISNYIDGSYQAYISIDGWSKLINLHPQFGGMSLRDSTELIDGIPAWMECTIYRNDRILPIVIKEYLEEVKTEHISWQRMPRRMLRHRVIQQCARLAFGISASDVFENKPTISIVSTEEPQMKDQIQSKRSRSELLKEKLSQ